MYKSCGCLYKIHTNSDEEIPFNKNVVVLTTYERFEFVEAVLMFAPKQVIQTELHTLIRKFVYITTNLPTALY